MHLVLQFCFFYFPCQSERCMWHAVFLDRSWIRPCNSDNTSSHQRIFIFTLWSHSTTCRHKQSGKVPEANRNGMKSWDLGCLTRPDLPGHRGDQHLPSDLQYRLRGTTQPRCRTCRTCRIALTSLTSTRPRCGMSSESCISRPQRHNAYPVLVNAYQILHLHPIIQSSDHSLPSYLKFISQDSRRIFIRLHPWTHPSIGFSSKTHVPEHNNTWIGWKFAKSSLLLWGVDRAQSSFNVPNTFWSVRKKSAGWEFSFPGWECYEVKAWKVRLKWLKWLKCCQFCFAGTQFWPTQSCCTPLVTSKPAESAEPQF